MKIVQTFWSGAATGPTVAIQAGWMGCEYHWMSWALSCLQLTQLYGGVELVTDERGKALLVDQLGLPYSKVHTILDERLQNYLPEFWSLAKIVSYAQQQEPFLHIDGDFFIWQKLPEHITQAEVVAQNLEINLSYYRSHLNLLAKEWQHIHPLLQVQDLPDVIYSANAGIFGGQNIAFIQDYCKAAFAFLDDNRADWHKAKVEQLNVIFEQYLLYYIAEYNKVPITYLMEPVDEPSYADYGRFEDVPNVPLIHTMAGFKKIPFTCGHLARRLRYNYPDYYYRIIELCQQAGIPLQHQLYNDKALSVPSLLPAWVSAATNCYTTTAKPLFKQVDQLPITGFSRSIATLEYLGQPVPTVFTVDMDINRVVAHIADLVQRQRVTEIIQLEMNSAVMIAHLENDDFVKWSYGRDKVQYEKSVGLAATDYKAATIQLDSLAQVYSLGCNWNMASVEDMHGFIATVLNDVEASQTIAVLAVDILNKQVNEIYLEGLEAAILQECTTPQSLKVLISKIRLHFDEAELEGNEAAFEQLVVSEVRRLVYQGILAF